MNLLLLGFQIKIFENKVPKCNIAITFLLIRKKIIISHILFFFLA